jgi:hypothetical protein
MNNKKRSQPKEKPSQTPCLGISTFNRVEKLTEVIPVKVQYSLKKIIPKPKSTWIRGVILEKLERLEEETI